MILMDFNAVFYFLFGDVWQFDIRSCSGGYKWIAIKSINLVLRGIGWIIIARVRYLNQFVFMRVQIQILLSQSHFSYKPQKLNNLIGPRITHNTIFTNKNIFRNSMTIFHILHNFPKSFLEFQLLVDIFGWVPHRQLPNLFLTDKFCHTKIDNIKKLFGGSWSNLVLWEYWILLYFHFGLFMILGF